MNNYTKLFKYYKQLGDKAMNQLPDESAFFWAPESNSNSIAIIVQHLYGNMKSRWTDFLTTDGEKEWRNREQEFELHVEDSETLLGLWDKGWAVLFTALEQINDSNLDQLVYIRSKGHTVEEALQRQLAHYAYHVGQLVYLSRLIVGEPFKSLSIPKGDSGNYNEASFSKGNREEHFTDAFLENKLDAK